MLNPMYFRQDEETRTSLELFEIRDFFFNHGQYVYSFPLILIAEYP